MKLVSAFFSSAFTFASLLILRSLILFSATKCVQASIACFHTHTHLLVSHSTCRCMQSIFVIFSCASVRLSVPAHTLTLLFNECETYLMMNARCELYVVVQAHTIISSVSDRRHCYFLSFFVTFDVCFSIEKIRSKQEIELCFFHCSFPFSLPLIYIFYTCTFIQEASTICR